MNLYPVNLNITDRKCVLVGGGQVALRKLRTLLECGPELVIIGPDISSEMAALITKHNILYEKRGYRVGDLKGAFLCIAATNDRKIQQEISEEAAVEKVLLNSVTNPELCDFQVPSSVRRGELLVAVSTCGGSPALSKKIRKQMEREFGPEYAVLVKLFSELRQQLLASSLRPESLQPIFQLIDSDNCLRHIIADDWQALENDLQSQLPETCGVARIIELLREETKN